MKKVGLLCGREYSFPPAFIARVNELGKKDGVAAEFVKLGGTRMGEPAKYSVIVDRISHEVEYYRGYLKHAVLQGTYVINNPFWWTADDKYFNYSVAAKLGIAIPKTVLLPQKGYPSDVDITGESLHNLEYPVDWEGLLDYVGRPAILKPYSGGGWKHVYKVNNKEELLAAYDKTSPYCMTLQEFIDFNQYVRCFTFGKMDILPVHCAARRSPCPGVSTPSTVSSVTAATHTAITPPSSTTRRCRWMRPATSAPRPSRAARLKTSDPSPRPPRPVAAGSPSR